MIFIPHVMVLTYIASCFRIGVAPWRYWQLNARYFSETEGIFSKLKLDELIPDRWRLPQSLDSVDIVPERFPVFLKPEWSQNAHGIERADDLPTLQILRRRLADRPERYLIQQAAPGKYEYEIFGIDSRARPNEGAPGYERRHDVLTVTEAVNTCERFPVNSKFNRDTCYVEITDAFSEAGLDTLSGHLDAVGHFGISRLSARADSCEALLAGDFHVIEINLFVPMPINLLDRRHDWRSRWRFIRPAMMALAQATRAIEPVAEPSAIFSLMTRYDKRLAKGQIERPARGALHTDSVHARHGS